MHAERRVVIRSPQAVKAQNIKQLQEVAPDLKVMAQHRRANALAQVVVEPGTPGNTDRMVVSPYLRNILHPIRPGLKDRANN